MDGVPARRDFGVLVGDCVSALGAAAGGYRFDLPNAACTASRRTRQPFSIRCPRSPTWIACGSAVRRSRLAARRQNRKRRCSISLALPSKLLWSLLTMNVSNTLGTSAMAVAPSTDLKAGVRSGLGSSTDLQGTELRSKTSLRHLIQSDTNMDDRLISFSTSAPPYC